MPPRGSTEAIRHMLMGLSNGSLIKPINVKKTPSNKYSIYNSAKNDRVLLRVTRLIDASRAGDMASRLVPFGEGGKFTTSVKQIKLKTFDVLVTGVMGSNAILYFVHTRDAIRDIIKDHFVDGGVGDGISVSIIHGRRESPKDRTKRRRLIEKEEFLIHIKDYRAMRSFGECAELMTYDPRGVVEYLTRK